MERDVLDDAVALVEDAEDGDALGHGRHSALALGGRGNLARLGQGCILLLATLAAGNQRQRESQRCSNLEHAYSGIHGS